MTDGKILEKYINLDNSCLTESEKVQLRDMIYKYKEVFSLRDEIGTCPNIEIDIDITDKMPFFIRPYQVREEDKRVLACVKPLCSQLEAIQKLEPPKTVKGCRSFAGMVNFLSIFCQDPQKLLKPIYDLTRKGKPFIWQQEQQSAFEEIKSRLQKPPILHLPDGKGRFHLYSGTSIYATGSALYQIQNGKPKLIAYASKRLPEAARNYSITEL